jgi:hypothetical protein
MRFIRALRMAGMLIRPKQSGILSNALSTLRTSITSKRRSLLRRKFGIVGLLFFFSSAARAASVVTGYVQTAPPGVQPANPNVTSLTAGQITDTALTLGGCVQATNTGLITVTGVSCGTGSGGGGGSSTTTLNNAILQVVHYSTQLSTHTVAGDGATFINSFIQPTITPTETGSTIYIYSSIPVGLSASPNAVNVDLSLQLRWRTGARALIDGYTYGTTFAFNSQVANNNDTQNTTVSLLDYDVPSTLSPVTYTLQFGNENSNAVAYINTGQGPTYNPVASVFLIEVGTASVSGSGGPNGTINLANQYAVTYYSFAGSSNVISGVSPGTAGQYLTTQGASGPPTWTTDVSTIQPVLLEHSPYPQLQVPISHKVMRPVPTSRSQERLDRICLFRGEHSPGL